MLQTRCASLKASVLVQLHQPELSAAGHVQMHLETFVQCTCLAGKVADVLLPQLGMKEIDYMIRGIQLNSASQRSSP